MIPAVNAEIDGDDIVYRTTTIRRRRRHGARSCRSRSQGSRPHVDCGDRSQDRDFGKRARDGKLGINDMQGGTFTISNGGVYGSMLSTPFSMRRSRAFSACYRIEEGGGGEERTDRGATDDVSRASYDHRIVDGKEAVTFLVRVKECLEDPQRFILEL